jgi:hypothetical protein
VSFDVADHLSRVNFILAIGRLLIVAALVNRPITGVVSPLDHTKKLKDKINAEGNVRKYE